MNIFGILCSSAGAQNFPEGPGHTGNDVIYTRSLISIGSLIWFECITLDNAWTVKYHNSVFAIRNTETFSLGRWLCGCKWKNLGKND